MRDRILRFFIFVSMCFFILSTNSSAGKLDLEGNINLWWDVYEENENGVQQARTQAPAADVASGFNLKQGRIVFNYEDAEKPISARFQIRLEERVAILDCYGTWCPAPFLNLYLGQMKVPSTYEALTTDSELDFISRTNLSENLTDWSLSRSPYYSAFYGNYSYQRDLGVGIKGKLALASNRDFASYFLMVGNGLGANLFIGGKESKESIYTNDVGDYFYGARIDVSPLKYLSFGGHYSINRHDNMIYNDEKTVFDLDRFSWSVDSRLEISGFQLAAMYGEGQVDDDYFYTTEKDLKYSGYEAKLLVWLIRERLQMGLRYDVYSHRFLQSGLDNDQNDLTIGINFIPIPKARLQLNYVFKETVEGNYPDLADNILFLSFQYSFSAENLEGNCKS